MTPLGCGVVVSDVADLPCGILQKTFTGNPSQWPGPKPSRQGIADLVESQAFDRVRGAIVVVVSIGKKRLLLLPLVPRQSTALASCSDTSDSLGSDTCVDESSANRGPRNDRSQARLFPL